MTLEKKRPLEAVLFDLDGTLLDTAPEFVHCIQQLCQQKGIRAPDPSEFSKQVSNGAGAMIQMAFNISRQDPSLQTLVDEFLAIYEENIGHASTFFAGISDLLCVLENANIQWGIITNKPVRFAQPLINNLTINPGCLICPDHVSARKPDPESLLLACTQMQLKAKHCIYIGDHQRDIDAGKSAGMQTIAAAYGYIDDNDSAAEWKADYYAANSEKIIDIITQYFEITS